MPPYLENGPCATRLIASNLIQCGDIPGAVSKLLFWAPKARKSKGDRKSKWVGFSKVKTKEAKRQSNGQDRCRERSRGISERS
mmetsp:Transcript_21933/g.53053  ORF Transcript_21933/g.53053 Transcript_21933/m.53053 type:complete len:83 (-) Transcript_21933:264-512(-)